MFYGTGAIILWNCYTPGRMQFKKWVKKVLGAGKGSVWEISLKWLLSGILSVRTFLQKMCQWRNPKNGIQNRTYVRTYVHGFIFVLTHVINYTKKICTV